MKWRIEWKKKNSIKRGNKEHRKSNGNTTDYKSCVYGHRRSATASVSFRVADFALRPRYFKRKGRRKDFWTQRSGKDAHVEENELYNNKGMEL